MSGAIDTRIDGAPEAIMTIAHFLGHSVSATSESWATDIDSGRTQALRSWSGKTADAFGSTVGTARKAVTRFGDETAELGNSVRKLANALTDAQQQMAEALVTAVAAGLTVTGSLVHAPGYPPAVQRSSEPPFGPTAASLAAAQLYAGKVAAWNSVVLQARKANEHWQQGLETMASAWDVAGGNLVTVTTGLVTAGASAGSLANTAFKLKSTILINKDRLSSALRSLKQLVHDGKLTGTKARFYSVVDDAADAQIKISTSEDMLRDGLKVGSKLSKGLLVLGLAGTGYGIYDDMQHGESAAQAVTSNAGGFLAGSLAGAGAGAVVGSFILPPAGTIAGAVVGGVVGIGVGIFTSGAIDHLFEDAGAGISDTFEAGFKEIGDTGKAIGDLASGAWHSIFG